MVNYILHVNEAMSKERRDYFIDHIIKSLDKWSEMENFEKFLDPAQYVLTINDVADENCMLSFECMKRENKYHLWLIGRIKG